jgi:thioredoxin-related protein
MNRIKFFILSFVIIFFASCNSDKAETKNEHGWITNLEDAYKIAKKENKHVFVLFTGSDWCPPCKKLHHDIFETEQFEKFAENNLILVELDFPRKKENKLSPEQTKYNQNLSRKFHVRGFPSVIMFDANGKELNRWVGYRPSDVQTMIGKYKEAMK